MTTHLTQHTLSRPGSRSDQVRERWTLVAVGGVCSFTWRSIPLPNSTGSHFQLASGTSYCGARILGVEGRIRVDLCHVEDLTLKPESLDAVYFVGSIVHMHSRKGLIHRMTRALKPGGRLFISDCYYPAQVRGDRNSRATTYILHEVLGYCLLRKLNEELRDLKDNSYVKTVKAWIENVRIHRGRIDALAPGFSATLQTYMRVGQRSFRRRTAIEYMILSQKAGGQHLDRKLWAVA